eukprot:6492320-Amphidinium_carterae.1
MAGDSPEPLRGRRRKRERLNRRITATATDSTAGAVPVARQEHSGAMRKGRKKQDRKAPSTNSGESYESDSTISASSEPSSVQRSRLRRQPKQPPPTIRKRPRTRSRSPDAERPDPQLEDGRANARSDVRHGSGWQERLRAHLGLSREDYFTRKGQAIEEWEVKYGSKPTTDQIMEAMMAKNGYVQQTSSIPMQCKEPQHSKGQRPSSIIRTTTAVAVAPWRAGTKQWVKQPTSMAVAAATSTWDEVRAQTGLSRQWFESKFGVKGLADIEYLTVGDFKDVGATVVQARQVFSIVAQSRGAAPCSVYKGPACAFSTSARSDSTIFFLSGPLPNPLNVDVSMLPSHRGGGSGKER